MTKQPDSFQVKFGQILKASVFGLIKALQIKVAGNKSVIVYNHINGYLFNTLMKVVFLHV